MSYKARIKFDNREWLIVDNIIFEDVKYYYIIEDISKELEKDTNYNGNLTLEFIYELPNGNYKNVTDEELISKLLQEVARNSID